MEGLGASSWVWEYEFSPNGTVTWRDPSSFEKGSGRWAMSPSLGEIFPEILFVTKESWQRSALIGGKNNKTYYSLPYFTGPYYVEKLLFDLPKTIQPDPEIEIDFLYDPQTEPNYNPRSAHACGLWNGNGGFSGTYVPETIYPIPSKSPSILSGSGAISALGSWTRYTTARRPRFRRSADAQRLTASPSMKVSAARSSAPRHSH